MERAPNYDQLELKNQISQLLSKHLESQQLDDAEVQERMDRWLSQLTEKSGIKLQESDRQRILQEAFQEILGFGPIHPLLLDDEISEIMVTGPNQVYIEKNGELQDTNIKFKDDRHVMQIIDRIIRPLGRSVDREHPMVDARLPDGSRVNIIIPPVSIDGPCISIRKFLPSKLSINDFISLGSLTSNMAEFLRACVVARLNILITGNTSSGKTTLLNILTAYIPNDERIITIEDAAELQLNQKYVVRLETKPPTSTGSFEILTRDLVRNALRMRPDRIIVGEVRSGEALDMLQAMNTGHTGSITTMHANAPRDAIARLETMAMMAGLELPILAIRRQIAAAINLIVHMARLEDGSRKVTHVTEVAGMEGEVVTLSDIFRFERTGIAPDGKILGELRPTRIRPLFSSRLQASGFKLGGEIFGAGMY